MSPRRVLLAAVAALVAAAYARVHLERRVTGPAPAVTPRPSGTPSSPARVHDVGRGGTAIVARRFLGFRQPISDGQPETGMARSDGPAVAAHCGVAWEPAVLARLARWVPQPPATAEARVRAYLWAAPLTLAGVAVALVSGVAPRLQDGVLVFEHARGPLAAYLRARRFSACTLGHVIIATGTLSPALLAHELVHVRQGERLGILLAPLYLALLLVYGYHANPLERAARLAQQGTPTRA